MREEGISTLVINSAESQRKSGNHNFEIVSWLRVVGSWGQVANRHDWKVTKSNCSVPPTKKVVRGKGDPHAVFCSRLRSSARGCAGGSVPKQERGGSQFVSKEVFHRRDQGSLSRFGENK